jgi:hypothetical protein
VIRRLLFGAAGIALLAAAFWTSGFGAWQTWVALIVPDVALLLGISPGLERGRLHPRAVPLYNALHLPLGPVALALVSVWLGEAWLAGAFAWGAHIAVDQALGYGLRTRDGYQRDDPRAAQNQGS